jgi:transcriptional regulator with XRE-family HTH domain
LASLSQNSREIARSLGRVVRQLREERSLSQEEFAVLTGHHRTYIGFLERGERSPNIETVDRIARALELKASDLLREAGY